MRHPFYLVESAILLSLFFIFPELVSIGHAVQNNETFLPPGNHLAEDSKQTTPPDLPEGTSSGWWSTIQKDIQDAEYQITWQENTFLLDIAAAWQAPNRSQNLRTYFTTDGVRVVPRTAKAPPWNWGLCLRGYGYQGRLHTVDSAELVPNQNRMEYRRSNGLIEWYVNDRRGLEQGFTLNEPPSPGVLEEETDSRIILRMGLHGNLRGTVNADQGGIDFITTGGVCVLRYGSLHAFDATGRDLPVTMTLNENGVDILVNADGAAYPLTVDPLASSPSWTAESDQSEAHFGNSVSTAGDVNGDGYADVIVGAYYYDNGQSNEGRAFVYHGSATGLAASPAWTVESDQEGAIFGRSVSTAGDVNGDGYADVIVGAPWYSNGQSDEGSAFVYHGSATGLATSPAWSAEFDQQGAWFGHSVSTAGDVNGDGYADIIVGAPRYSNGQQYEGRTFVYHGSAAGLAGTPVWIAESDQVEAYFGHSVSTAGDVNGDGYADAIIGAYWYDNGHINEGRAFVYHGSSAGLAAAPAWTAESDQHDAWFGYSVSTAGDVNGDGYADVIIGANHYSNDQSNEGRTFIYHGSATGLTAAVALTIESDQAVAWFGYSVSTAGDVNGDGYSDVIVGAIYYDNGQDNEGRAFMYYGSNTGLATSPSWTAESDQYNARFGWSVSTAGDVNGDGYADVIVGTYDYDNGQSNEGRAYVYHGSAGGLGTASVWTAESDQASALFGCSVSTAGDVNGDGYADVIIGAYQYDNGQSDEGRAFVYPGSATGLSSTPAWTAESDQIYSLFGYSVSTAGDVNGDGYADVIVGAFCYENGHPCEGRAFVYHGSAAGLGATPAWIAESDQAAAYFGRSVSTAGDVNGDGYADVIVGANDYSNDQERDGRAYVYHGSATGLSATPAWTADSDQAGAEFGRCVSTAGDVNGDGYSDVIVGAPTYTNGQSFEGRAYVYHGSAMGLNETAVWTAESDQQSANFGYSLSTAGDVNGDGYADVIVGAQGYSNDQEEEGRAYVYHGSATGLDATPSWTAEPDQAYVLFGTNVSAAGDVNGDGYGDVLVGAPSYNNGQLQGGRAYVYHGSATGLESAANWTAESDQDGAYLGGSVSTAGDLNGDGYADVIVGAQYFDNGQNNEGRAFVYYGNDGPGLACIPTQRQADDSTPIVHLGRSNSTSAFRLTLLGRTPFGRGKVKLQWEIKPMGTLFDGTGIGESAAWSDTGVAGADLNEIVEGLTPYTHYHWRVRLHWSDPSSLFSSHSRWMTRPWNGWQEADFRTLSIDSDDDGLLDEVEDRMCTNHSDADTDDDGIPDGVEDADHDGKLDAGETDPCDIDTDDDGIQDGTELGYTMDDVGPDTDETHFQGDEDNTTTTDPLDADTDDDGIPDGVEDADHDGKLDAGETDPCDIDTDGDGIQDGTESGYTLADVGPDTDQTIFQEDADDTTTTDPLDADSDNDRIPDGVEDANHNGRVDDEETDPNVYDRSNALPFLLPLLLDDSPVMPVDTDMDGILDDGDLSGVAGDNPCTSGEIRNCDDNCPDTPNPNQEDSDGDGLGDVCDDIDNTPFYEDWESGVIDTSVWKTWGTPTPKIVADAGYGEGHAVDPNGDDYHQSGLTTYRRFTLTGGTSISVYFNTDQTATYWQNIKLSLTELDADDVTELNKGSSIAGIYLRVETDLQNVIYYVGDDSFSEPYDNNDDGEYHFYEIRINQDGTFSFLKDNSLKWTSSATIDFSVHPDATLTIDGRSENTTMLADGIILSYE